MDLLYQILLATNEYIVVFGDYPLLQNEETTKYSVLVHASRWLLLSEI